MSEVKCGDFLAFYVFKPVDGVVAIYRVVSDPFEGDEDIWGGGRYPYRIRIEPIQELARGMSEPIPLHLVFGTFDYGRGVIVEPYLRGVSLLRIYDKQFES